jgi:hypothetical protein
MRDETAADRFFRTYQAQFVGSTPIQPYVPPPEEDDAGPEQEPKDRIDRSVEQAEADWKAIPLPEEPAREGEFPRRFIDGSQKGEPVLCVRSPQGYPIPMVLSEVGAVALKCTGRTFEREFAALERVLTFYADPFPWEEVEALSLDLLNRPELQLRILPAAPPDFGKHSPFDYEVMRYQAHNRAQREMEMMERLALASCKTTPTLVDGPIHRVSGKIERGGPLLVGVAKTHPTNYLHEQGWRTLLNLKPGQRTPIFRYESGGANNLPVATWYLKLAGGPRLAPNWGYVRVEVSWTQFEERGKDSGFVNRLSRWLIDARCRASSYARMPVSLEPIVRAEEALKPLFTPQNLLANRLYRSAGLNEMEWE